MHDEGQGWILHRSTIHPSASFAPGANLPLTLMKPGMRVDARGHQPMSMIRCLAALLLIMAGLPAAQSPPSPPPMEALPEDPNIIAIAEVPHPLVLTRQIADMLHGTIADDHGKEGSQFGRLLASISALGQDAPVMAVWMKVPDSALPTFAISIPSQHAQSLLQAILPSGWAGISTATEVLLASDHATLDQARKMPSLLAPRPLPAGIALHIRGDCTRAWLSLGDVLREEEILASMVVKGLPRPPGAPDLSPLLQLAMLGSLAVAQDVQDASLDASLDGQHLEVTTRFTPQPGSELAAAMAVPETTDAPDPHLLAGTDDTIAEIEARLNGRAWFGFLDQAIRRMARQVHLDLGETLTNALLFAQNQATGDVALHVSRDPVHGVRWNWCQAVLPGVQPDTIARSLVGFWTAGGPLATASDALGIPVFATLGAAGTVSGMRMYPVQVRVGPCELTSSDLAAAQSYMRDGYLAVTPVWILFAQDPAELASMAARPPGTVPVPEMEAKTVFGSGQDAYAECDPVALVRASYAVIAGQPLSRWLRLLLDPGQRTPPGQRILCAISVARPCGSIQLRVPLSPLHLLMACLRIPVEP